MAISFNIIEFCDIIALNPIINKQNDNQMSPYI